MQHSVLFYVHSLLCFSYQSCSIIFSSLVFSFILSHMYTFLFWVPRSITLVFAYFLYNLKTMNSNLILNHCVDKVRFFTFLTMSFDCWLCYYHKKEHCLSSGKGSGTILLVVVAAVLIVGAVYILPVEVHILLVGFPILLLALSILRIAVLIMAVALLMYQTHIVFVY